MKDAKLKIIGYRIRELRTEKQISQASLGEMLGVSQDTVSLWEQCKSLPPVDIIIQLSEFFCVSSDFILGIKDY